VILLAFGSFGNPRRFAALARRVSMRKPIVVVTPETPLVDALCRRTGVLRADSLDDLADLASIPRLPAAVERPAAGRGRTAHRHRRRRSSRLATDTLARDHGGSALTGDELRHCSAPPAWANPTRRRVDARGAAQRRARPLFGATLEVGPSRARRRASPSPHSPRPTSTPSRTGTRLSAMRCCD